MSDSEGGNPLQVALIIAALAGAGWYFFNQDKDSEKPPSFSFASTVDPELPDEFISYRDAPVMIGPGESLVANRNVFSAGSGQSTPNSLGQFSAGAPAANPVSLGQASVPEQTPITQAVPMNRHRSYRPIKVGSWALDGFGPTKLASSDVRKYLSKVVRRYDVLALQQVASIERDLIPRLVDVINGPEHRYDYVLGESTGPEGRQEQLAFIFDTTTLVVDRRQTYTISDPADQMTYDPLVASFRASEPPVDEAWTFFVINVRVDLANAADEVAILPTLLGSVVNNGRGEDDVILSGIFQADDDYLLPTMGKNEFAAAVKHRSTDIFGRYQTCNLLIASRPTSEFLGRGGVFDYRRNYNLSAVEAEAVTSHLPVFAEFTAHEGGQL